MTIKNLLMSTHTYLVATVLIAVFATTCNGHGRLIEPPSRASAWRYGFQTPPNYNDHELFCGGFNRQWEKNGGKCGECGDAWDLPTPRPNELGGKWGQGVIVRKYAPASDITVRVELTASHMGYFEFRVCPDAGGKQDCLDKHSLKILGGTPNAPMPSDLETRFYPRNGSRIYDIKARIPTGLKCNHCLFQWRYICGNNWGTCPDGTGAVGCGPQEEFRACADISIGGTGRTTMRPFKPTTRPSSTEPGSSTEVPLPGTEEELFGDYRYIGILIAALTLLLVICILTAIYLYHYHGTRVKHLLRWKHNQTTNSSATVHSKDSDPIEASLPPVPPPRAKRLSLIKDIHPEESSIITGQESPQSTA